MHFRNSCTRSTSAWSIRRVPSGASGARGWNGAVLVFTRKFHETSVTRSLTGGNARMGSTVTGFSSGSPVRPGLHKGLGPPVHLGRAGAALAGLAVPSDGEVVGLVGLDLMDGVEHHHPGRHGRGVVH